MIGYIEGRILHSHKDGILLLSGRIGYDILLSPVIVSQLTAHNNEDDGRVRLYIYYHVTERQPKPVLIGFPTLEEKDFFQLFITVSAIGPIKAVKALVRPVGEVADAIERKDVPALAKLPGIGKRTAEKIVATLHGKTARFAQEQQSVSAGEAEVPVNPSENKMADQVAEVLVSQLGHSRSSANRMIREALKKNPDINSAERLFDAIYQENA